MEYRLKNENLINEVNFWRNRNPVYDRVFSSFYSLIIAADIMLEGDKSIDNDIVVDFAAGIALMGIGLSKQDDEHIHNSELLIKPLIDLLNEFVSSDAYRNTLLKESITGTRTLNIQLGKHSHTIPITVEEIEKYITKDTILVNKKDVDSATYNFIESEIKKFNSIAHRNKNPKRKKEKSFIELFKDPTDAQKVKELFELRGYTKDGKWIGLNNNKTELLAAYYSLYEKGVLKPGKITPQAKIIYKEFGLKISEYISERSLTTRPYTKYIEEFDNLFSDIY